MRKVGKEDVTVVLVVVVSHILTYSVSAQTANRLFPELLPSRCGERVKLSGQVQPFIVGPGNTTAYYGQYPWQVRIEKLTDNVRYEHQCGGVIITDRHVLTAAHCVTHVAMVDMQVRVGDLQFGFREPQEQEFAVEALRVHEKFGASSSLPDDIAILRLRKRNGKGIHFGQYVGPLCLPEAWSSSVPGTECDVSGWGKTSDNSPVSRELRGITLPLIAGTECAAEEVYGTTFQPSRMLCAGRVNGGKDACRGDSGGPLACPTGENGRHTLHGIVSSGSLKGCATLPGRYTRVSAFVEWVLKWVRADREPAHGNQPGSIAAEYDLVEVMNQSLLFYEAQRSGRLPLDNRLPWRGDSALADRGIDGEDLTGGYYNAGGHLKTTFLTASTMTLMAWGLIEYREAYHLAGLKPRAHEALRWGLDYVIKCHVGEFELYGQVGDPSEYDLWRRPEEIKGSRPAWKVTVDAPGSDLAAEAAAALAAGSVVFRRADPVYSSLLLRHARQLYRLANRHRGLYHQAIPVVADFYPSTGDTDELVWAAAWLYRATNESDFLTAAKNIYLDFLLEGGTDWATEMSWDTKWPGVQMLMYQLVRDEEYRLVVKRFCDWSVFDGPRTPKGLLFLNKWVALGYAANSALICLMAAETGLSPQTYRRFAKQQIGYALGDTGRSFVVGFGVNPPQRVHHRASSCPSDRDCSWTDFHAPGPNPNVLHGALVSGPDLYDHFSDNRSDYVQNQPTTYGNAGFQGALAGLLYSEFL